MMKGVDVYDLKEIEVDKGNILHALKAEDEGYVGFGEAYFSQIKYGAIKGWKRHNEFVLNIIVPVGEIKFVIFDDRVGSATYRSFFEIKLSPSRNYKRICVQPGLWMAFQGLTNPYSILLDIIPGAHVSSEADSVSLDKIEYDFKS